MLSRFKIQDSFIDLNRYTVSHQVKHIHFNITKIGYLQEVYTQIGLDVTWDGEETVQLHTSARWSGELCGLCGNYNNVTEDDLIVGPACPDNAGEVVRSQHRASDWSKLGPQAYSTGPY